MSVRQKVSSYVASHGTATSGEVAKKLKITTSSASYHLQALRKEGVIRSLGRGQGGGYEWVEPAADRIEVSTGTLTLEEAKGWVHNLRESITPHKTPGLRELMSEESPFAADDWDYVINTKISAECFKAVKDLPMAVGLAALSLISNDVETAKMLLESA